MTQEEYDKQESEKRKALKEQWGIKFLVGDKCREKGSDDIGVVGYTYINSFYQEIVKVIFNDDTIKEFTAEQLVLIEI